MSIVYMRWKNGTSLLLKDFCSTTPNKNLQDTKMDKREYEFRNLYVTNCLQAAWKASQCVKFVAHTYGEAWKQFSYYLCALIVHPSLHTIPTQHFLFYLKKSHCKEQTSNGFKLRSIQTYLYNDLEELLFISMNK